MPSSECTLTKVVILCSHAHVKSECLITATKVYVILHHRRLLLLSIALSTYCSHLGGDVTIETAPLSRSGITPPCHRQYSHHQISARVIVVLGRRYIPVKPERFLGLCLLRRRDFTLE